MKEPLSARELVERAQAGDQEVFGLLIDRYGSRLEALIHLRMGPRLRRRVEIEDILQEIWKRAFKSIREFTWIDEGALFRWLGGIAENVIKYHVRYHFKTKKRQDAAHGVSLTFADERSARKRGPDANEDTSPSQALRRQERFDRLEAALSNLSKEHREVIILAQLRGLSRKEIGERMGRSADAVSMLLLRALRQLRQVFGETDSLRLPPLSLAGSSSRNAVPPFGTEDDGGSGSR